jgi:outer membrane protein assembly factor BamB
MIGVFSGTSLSALSEINSATNEADNNYTASSAGLSFPATAGTTYYIVLDSEVSSTGTSAVGAFRLSCIDSEWETLSNGGLTTLAIAADGTLHGTDRYGDVYALNPDGSRKWRYTMTGYGTFSAPAVAADGTVYCGDDYNYVHAITATGTRKWRITTGGIVQSSPALAPDGTIYIRSDDGKLYALNPADGSTKWTATIGISSLGTSYSSPVVAPDGTIYCAGASSRLYAITPAGATKWTFQTDFIFASPSIAADGTIYLGVSAPTRRMYALRPDGTTKWEFIVGDSVSSSAAIGADGTIYFGSADKKLYAVNSAGDLRWTYEAGAAIRNSSPTIASDGSIYVGCTDGKLYCVEPEGTLRRTYATANEVRSSPILQNGRLYVSSWDYRLYAVEVGQVTASTPWPMHRQNLTRSARLQSPALAFGVQPVAQTAAVEDKVTFIAGAVGTAPLSYQWLFSGQNIAGATSATYRLDSVNHVNGGAYSVRVTDTTGSILSNPATLTISTPLVLPTVATAPAAQTTLAGNSVTLNVVPAGSAPFTFQWHRDGEPIAGATNNTLALGVVKSAASGSYTVTIKNFGGTVTSPAAVITVNPPTRISNLSVLTSLSSPTDNFTLGYVGGGNATSGTKPLVLRAAGPSLGALGVGGTLDDPKLELFAGSAKTGENDNWGGSAPLTSALAAVGAFPYSAPTSKDAATTAGITTRDNSVKISAASEGTGLVIAEIYDATQSADFSITTPRLLNVSVLKSLGTGLTVGFTIAGTTPKTVLLRAIGPTLGDFGVPGTVVDPQLVLFNASSVKVAENDNWGGTSALTAAFGSVGAFALPPNSRDAALLTTLPPGGYSVQVTGVANTTGAALVEVYEVP